MIAACAIAGGSAPPAAAQDICQLLDNCPATTAAAAHVPDPGGQESPDQPVPPAGKAFGFNSGLTLDRLASPAQELNEVQQAGGRYLRFTLGWRWLQPNASDPPLPAAHPGSTVLLLDDLYQQALARGIRLVLIPAAAPLWATRYSSCGPLDVGCRQAQLDYNGSPWENFFLPDTAHLPAFRTFVSAVKQRWPNVLIEAWNEPNLYYGMSDKPAWASAPPTEFKEIQCAAYGGSKSVNADPVLAAGWATNQYEAYVDAVYAAGGKDCWDLANAHLYYGGETAFGANSELARLMSRTRNLRNRYGDADPIWVTETGYTTTGSFAVSEAAQADGLRRVYNRLVSMPDVAAVLVHTVRERSGGSGDPETGYGLLRADGTPKPAYCMLSRMAGSTIVGCP